ncbi:MAG: ABC transporter permease subunit [Alphaproteobacteria bacterium]
MSLYLSVHIAFLIVQLDPVRALLGPLATPEAVTAYRAQLGLDRSFLNGVFIALWRLIRLDFGVSYFQGVPAITLVGETASGTLFRAAAAILLGLTSGIIGAVLMARVRGAVAIAAGLAAVPSLVWIVLLLWTVANGLGATPLGAPRIFDFLTVLISAVIPASTCAAYMITKLSDRGQTESYPLLLRQLGAPRRAVAVIVLRHELAPLLMLAVNAVPAVVSAVAVAELIYGVPGLGALLIRACVRGDLPVIHAATLLLALIYFILQRLATVAVSWNDARHA